MKKLGFLSFPDVTIVVPTRNAESTILKAFAGIRKQDYPIAEVILVDNVSTDHTVALARHYGKKHPSFPLRIVVNERDFMVARSFNKGIRLAKTDYVVAMHGDCCFAGVHELQKLVSPIMYDQNVIATYGVNETPLRIWEEYSFWEKCLMATHTGKPTPGLVGKIDCYHKPTLLSIGGYDEVGYASFGGEDADLHLRLSQKGKIVGTKAKVLHLHYLDKNFSLQDWVRKKKATARTYGRLLRIQGFRLGSRGILAFLVKPILALGVFIPGFTFVATPALMVFPFWYYHKMFTSASTLRNPRIILLPFLGIFLVYYETFWIIESFFERVEHSRYGKI